VRLLHVAGLRSVTVGLASTGQSVTVSETSGGIELVSKAPLGRRKPPEDRAQRRLRPEPECSIPRSYVIVKRAAGRFMGYVRAGLKVP